MRSRFVRVSLFSLASCGLVASCTDDATSTTEDTAPNGAVIIRGDQPLTPPSSASPDRIVREFLKTRGAGSAVDQLHVVRQSTPFAGITHIVMGQTIDGLRVHGAYAKAAIDSQGQLVQVIDHVVRPQGAATKLTVSADQAIATTFAELGFEATAEFVRAPSAERVAYLDDHNVLRQGFLVETWSRTDNVLEETLIGWNGKVISSENRTASDSYNVFVEDPLKGGQAVVSGPGAGNAASPTGWLAGAQTTRNIRGNNARAYLDRDSNNAADSGGTAVLDGNFLAVADLTTTPTTAGNQDVAVQNLFYLNNIAHDALYNAGFNEAAGNFQVNNFGKGGADNDPVNAEAQDGGGTDNANFATPSDGSSPRMQMYLWTSALGDHQVLTGANSYSAAGAGFGPALTTSGFTGNLAAASVTDGCTAFTGVAGKIAIVDRGNCDFTVKVMNAQNAGAVGAIVANNAGDGVFTMGGTNRKIKIPSVMVGQSAGAALRAESLGAQATLRKNPTPPPQLDGDVDADIVFHEYGHGLTWRMIGSMSGPLSGAIGEGASDTVAFLMNGDDVIGEYSASSAVGIRRFPYADYPNTYGDYCNQGCQVHSDGEIYAAAMWRLRGLYLAAGLSAADLLTDFVQGMNFTPAGPAFEDMRDGMLQAVGPDRDCLVWQAFAASGIGVGADARLVKGGRSVTVTESFTVPAECQ